MAYPSNSDYENKVRNSTQGYRSDSGTQITGKGVSSSEVWKYTIVASECLSGDADLLAGSEWRIRLRCRHNNDYLASEYTLAFVRFLHSGNVEGHWLNDETDETGPVNEYRDSWTISYNSSSKWKLFPNDEIHFNISYSWIKIEGKLIKSSYGTTLNTKNIEFIKKTMGSIELFMHGQGSYAAIMKGRNSDNKKIYAVRFFTSAASSIKKRYERISEYLNKCRPSWMVDIEYIDNEITINGNNYPVLFMEWLDGNQLNDFLEEKRNSPRVLDKLIDALFELSKNLEKDKIGHGDIQPGNIFLISRRDHVELKLIDYDNMYVPGMDNYQTNEEGLPEFQHPSRGSLTHLSAGIDRFSIWILILTVEALKSNEDIWDYCDDDNLLFTHEDFSDPYNSEIFDILKNSDNDQVKSYTETVLSILEMDDFDDFPLPEKGKIKIKPPSVKKPVKKIKPKTSSDIVINANFPDCAVKDATLKTIGTTPLTLKAGEYRSLFVFYKGENIEVDKNILSDGGSMDVTFQKQGSHSPMKVKAKPRPKPPVGPKVEQGTYTFEISNKDLLNPLILIEIPESSSLKSSHSSKYKCTYPVDTKVKITFKADDHAPVINNYVIQKYKNRLESVMLGESYSDQSERFNKYRGFVFIVSYILTLITFINLAGEFDIGMLFVVLLLAGIVSIPFILLINWMEER